MNYKIIDTGTKIRVEPVGLSVDSYPTDFDKPMVGLATKKIILQSNGRGGFFTK